MLQSEVKIDNLDNTKHLTANYVKEYVKNNPIYKTIPSSTERNELIQNFIKEINDKRYDKLEYKIKLIKLQYKLY